MPFGAVMPEVLQYIPGEQDVQVRLLTARVEEEYDPAGHKVGSAEAAGQYDPAGQRPPISFAALRGTPGGVEDTAPERHQ